MKTNTTTYYAANIAALLLTLGLSLYTFRLWTAVHKLLEKLTPPVRAVVSRPVYQIALAAPFCAKEAHASMSRGTPYKESLRGECPASRLPCDPFPPARGSFKTHFRYR